MERKAYIENNEVEQALNEYLTQFPNLSSEQETVKIDDSLGRVTFEAVFAKICDPVYNASAMDGIMLRAEKTFGASESNPLNLRLHEDFEYANTGAAISTEYDAVIMIEDIVVTDNENVRIIAPAYPWQHIRTVGESIVYGEMLLPQKHKIRPADLGALIAGGHKDVKVYKKPRVALISTGAELITEPSEIETGKLMESNSYVFAGLTREHGGEPVRYPIVRDDYDILIETLKKAAEENDIVVLNAGTSAGTKDYTLKAINTLGKTISHGMAVKPGKPTILGQVDGKPVIGVPGYPVSAFLMFETFVKPLIISSVGLDNAEKNTVSASITRRVVKSVKNKELIRVALGYVGGKFVATPLERGAAAVMSLVKADGILEVPRKTEGLEAGEAVEIELLKPIGQIMKTLTIIGSHDLIIDLIADKMKVSSAHTGSMGGITALMRGECHIAPIHLLDEETGEYNISFVNKYFQGKKMALIKGVERIQGLIVPKGNPDNVTGFASLKDGKITFANRQRGAGTRLLLDYCLKNEGISTNEIKGYEKELTTHMAVAIAVKSGVCGCGLGILSAAKAMDLDFIEIGGESYDFLIYEKDLEEPRVKQFISLIKSEQFIKDVEALGGYGVSGIGETRIIE